MPDDLRDQFPKVRRIVAAMGIPVYELSGYEADDVIGTLTVEAERLDLETTIVTGDLDMLQLVSPRTSLMTTRLGVQNTIIYDVAKIHERYSLRPDQMLDYKAVKGDSTDNIPGVPGIGEKTAAKLIGQFETLEGLYEHLDEVTPPKLREPLADARERVFRSRDLMRIVRDLPVPLDLGAAKLDDYDREAVIRLFREYEFRTLIDRLPALAGESPEAAAAALREVRESGSIPAAQVAGAARPEGWGLPKAGAEEAAELRPAARRPLPPQGAGLQLAMDFDAVAEAPADGPDGAAGARSTNARGPGEAPGDPRSALAAAIADPGMIEVVGEDGVDELRAWIAAQPEVGVAIVLTDPRPLRGEPLALAVAGADGRSVAAEGPVAATRLRWLLEELDAPLVGHEVKHLLVARLADDPGGPSTRVAFDTQIGAYILNASLRSQTIADVVAERLDLILPPPAAGLPATARAGLEALGALAVRPSIAEQLEGEGLARLYREIEVPLIPVLARMEATGVALDEEALSLLEREFGEVIDRLEREIWTDVGHEFNLGSPKQLEQVLFYELDLPKGRRTKTGYSTDATVLEDLRPAHPMIGKLLDWRVYTKLRSTYVEALPTLLSPLDGRLHTTFHQAVASTGRLSSSDPNLQNIPIRTELGRRIRRAFVAGAPDLTLLAADYSQIELRILAHVSGDEHLKEAFAAGEDIHRATAARVLHKEPADVTSGDRSMAKMVNFGLAYGMSDFGLASRAGIERREAQEFINAYFASYSGISYYMMAIKERARDQGFVTTLLGRRRAIPELQARNAALRGAGERMAINMPIQGTAADIVKIAMIRVDERVRAAGLRARLLLSVHDELLFEVPRDEVEALATLVRETMETALPLDVPLTVDVKVGDDWEGMRPMTRRDAVLAEVDEAPEELPAASSVA
jgi:DNA polymerase-1